MPISVWILNPGAYVLMRFWCQSVVHPMQHKTKGRHINQRIHRQQWSLCICLQVQQSCVAASLQRQSCTASQLHPGWPYTRLWLLLTNTWASPTSWDCPARWMMHASPTSCFWRYECFCWPWKEKKRKDYVCWRQSNEKPSFILSCWPFCRLSSLLSP